MRILKFALTLCMIGLVGHAAEDASSLLQEVRNGYAGRDQFDATKGGYYTVVSSIETAKKIVTLPSAPVAVKVEAQILASRGIYWIGIHTSDKQSRLEKFAAAMNFANAAKTLNSSIADSYYYYGLALGRWAETNGILDSLGRKDELIQSMTETQSKKDLAGQPGGKIDGFGPARVMGRIYFKLPFFAGGSRDKALQLLGVAYSKAPENFLNGIYYAEVLADGGSDEEKSKACEILKGITSKKAIDGIADRLPENKEDIAEATRLFSALCK